MRNPIGSSRARFLLGLALGGGLLASCLGGLAEVDGERAETGNCPTVEICSEETPAGLRFVGQHLFDDANLRLGPVIAGGTFDLGFYALEGKLPEGFTVEIDDPGVLEVEYGRGVFGPRAEDGSPMYSVDAYLTLYGLDEGATWISIIDPETGALYDRLRMDVVAVDDVSVVRLSDRGSTVLPAGGRELMGVRLVVDGGRREIRAIDQSLEFRAAGTVQPELMYWDCFEYEVPADRSEVEFEIVTAGRTFRRSFEVSLD